MSCLNDRAPKIKVRSEPDQDRDDPLRRLEQLGEHRRRA
jgi:hypothetical protein